MRQDTESALSQTYELKIAMFENGKPEELIKTMNNFKTAINGTGTTSVSGKTNYLYTLQHREYLQEFDDMEIQVTGTKDAHTTPIKEGLLAYFFKSLPLPSSSAQ